MRVHRRAFLQSSVVVTAWMAASKFARASDPASCSAGPLLIELEAQGAWDPTFHCDAHSDARFTPWSTSDLAARTLSSGLVYAPFLNNGVKGDYAYGTTPQPFFVKHQDKLVVINGIDNQTVSHDVGPRVAFTGGNRDGVPSLAAMVASSQGASAPLAFLSSGGFTESLGLVSVTRSAGTSVLRTLTRPNAPQSNNPASPQRFLPDSVDELVRQRVRDRDARLLQATTSPRERGVISRLLGVRDPNTSAQFDAFSSALDGAAAQADPNPLKQTGGAVLAAMRAGACHAAHLSTSGFDTHDQHDVDHPQAVDTLLAGLDFLIDEIENNPQNAPLLARGVVIVVGSDFGRSVYNGNATSAEFGKDHWNITSMLCVGLGAASSLVQGGRVVGKTSTGDGPGVVASKLRINGTGALVPCADTDAGAVTLTSGHVHVALRHALGIAGCGLDARFPLTSISNVPLPILRV